MENDLISRACIYRQLCMSTDKDGALKRIPDTDCDNFPIMLHIRDVRRAILKAPAVDAVQVRHGRWTKTYRSGMLVKTGCVSSCCDMWSGWQSDYCPSCGARMDEEAPNDA